MHPLLVKLAEGFTFVGPLRQDVPAFLVYHGCPRTAEHCGAVAAEARRVALLAGDDPWQAEQAGWLHDVSAIFPTSRRVEIARELGITPCPEEEAFPLIIHQKLSVVLARDLFGVRDPLVLDAIGCHTTLRGGATRLDKILFVADKLAWDQPGIPPYREELLAALERSLDGATTYFLAYLWERRATLKVIHPWLREAYHALVQPEAQGKADGMKRSNSSSGVLQ